MIRKKIESKVGDDFNEMPDDYSPSPGEVVRETFEHGDKEWVVTRVWPDKSIDE